MKPLKCRWCAFNIKPSTGVKALESSSILMAHESGHRAAFENLYDVVVKSRKEWRLVNGDDLVDSAHQGIINEIDKLQARAR